MSVENQDYRNTYPYTGLGDYELSFDYDVTSSVDVEWISDAGISSGVKVEGVDYEIVRIGAAAYVRVLVDFGTGGTIVAYRNMPYTQTYNFPDGSEPPPSGIERAIDRVVWQVQQVFGAIRNALKAPASEDVDMTIPSAAARRNTILGFEDTAEALPFVFAGVPSVPVSPYVAPGLLSADEAAFLAYYGAAAAADLGHIATTEFQVTSAGWYTLLRTQKNFNGLVKLSAYADNLKDFITFSFYGGEDAEGHKVTVLESSRDGSIAGITQARWGDAGAGNGMNLQLYIDPDTDANVRIKATTFGAKPADDNSGAGFAFGPHSDTQTDLDDNVITFRRTYYRAALAELIRSNPYRDSRYPDIVVDGTTVTRVEPGIYNSIHFTGNGSMGIGKYVVLEDFTVDVGATVSVDRFEGIASPSDFSLILQVPWQVKSECSAASTPPLSVHVISFAGGGKAGKSSGTGGVSGPCGSSRTTTNRDTVFGESGGYALVNVIGDFTLDGNIDANGAQNATARQGAGGYFGYRCLGIASGTGGISADADAQASASGGSGGGVIEEYLFGAALGGTRSVAHANGDISSGYSATDGSNFSINLIDQPGRINGGSNVVTNDEYLHAGQVPNRLGGWWL